MTDVALQTLPAEKIHVILTEVLRGELARILADQDKGLVLEDREIDDRIEMLDQRSRILKRAARRNDYSEITPQVREAAIKVGITLPASLPGDLGRRAVDLIRVPETVGKILRDECRGYAVSDRLTSSCRRLPDRRVRFHVPV